MQLTIRYESTVPGSQFVAPVYYLISEGVEYKLLDVVEKLYINKLIDKQIYDKLKNASAKMIALTIKEYLHKL